MTVTRALFVFAGAFSLIAVALAVIPIATPTIPKQPPAPEVVATADFESLARWFDFSTLPAPEVAQAAPTPPSPPPPDPAQALKSYRFIGLSISEWRAVGVFSRASETLVLTPGATLEGFILLSVSAQGAEFQNNDGVSVVLTLEEAPSR